MFLIQISNDCQCYDDGFLHMRSGWQNEHSLKAFTSIRAPNNARFDNENTIVKQTDRS